MTSNVLHETQLQRLKEHKYNAEGRSVLEPIFQPYWCWTVERVPRWVAPNLLTLFGLFCNVLPIVFMIWQSPQARDEISASVLVLSAVGMFLYQTLDAIDGKQARRTGTSSPLGELFDHGCDSVSHFFDVCGLMCTVMMGREPVTLFLAFFSGLLVFFVAHWSGYVRGKLTFGWFDVTEGQCCYMLLYLCTAFTGCEFWNEKIFYFKNREILVFAVGAPLLLQYVRMLQLISHGGQGKNGSTVAGTSILSPVIPLVIVLTGALYGYKHSQNNLFQVQPLLSCSLYGIVVTKLACKLIVASMTKHSFDMLDVSMIGPFIMALINYMGLFKSYELTILIAAMIMVSLDLVVYATKVCQEICNYLEISCLSIPYNNENEKKSK